MFNKYFFEQFSSSSTYDINIDFSNDDLFDIDFNCTRIKELLDNINVNKAAGPDGIHGHVLKKCSKVLVDPYPFYSSLFIILEFYRLNGNRPTLYQFIKRVTKP